jgi:D-3-phosphoglycerate dehydrogenase
MTRLVAISTSSFGRHDRSPLELLEDRDWNVRLNPHGRRLTAEEVGLLLDGATALIAGTEPLTRDVLTAAPNLRVISRCGVGLDNVDLGAAADLGIEVTATRFAHVDAVAELTLGGLLCLLRHVARADRSVRDGGWAKAMGGLLRGKTVGLVGLGRTGRAFARLLAPFDVRLLATDPMADTEAARGLGVELLSLDALLARADVVSLHLPYSPEVHHLLDADALARMKEGSYLVNCARGGLVDEAALAASLDSGHLAGAYLDVFEREPYDGPLAASTRTLLTTHLGSYALESRVAMELEAVGNLLRSGQRTAGG